MVEAPEPVPWSQPVDLTFSNDLPLPDVGLGSGPFNALFADGAVHSIPKYVDHITLRALITRNGGEMVMIPGTAPSPPPKRPALKKKSAPKRAKEIFK
jgi:hypothetical protein